MWSGAKPALEDLAEQSGALLATTLLGKGLFDGNPFAIDIAGTFATDLGRELFAESDLAIAADAGLGHYTTEGGYLFPNARVVRIDTQPKGLRQGLKPADLHVQADPRAPAAARDNGKVLLIDGDGSLYQHIQELETIRRHGMKILICIINDGGYGAETHKFRVYGVDPMHATHGRGDLAQVAATYMDTSMVR